MNRKIRLNAKNMLSGNTQKLFLVSLFSFILRYSGFALTGLIFILFYDSNVFGFLTKNYGEVAVYLASGTASVFLIFFLSVLFTALKTGERYIYYSASEGGKVRFKGLFRFLKPSHSFKNFALSLRLVCLKFGWFIFLIIPVLICFFGYFVIYNSKFFSEIQLYIMSIALSIITGFFTVMVKLTFSRYDYCFYSFCVNPKEKIGKIIKKSIRVTDTFLNENVLLKYSLWGWAISSFLIIPAFYAIPYIKLTKAGFVSSLAYDREPVNSNFAINVLSILPEAN